MPVTPTNDLRLIEHGFPCHQVGAETRRERNASSALPPLYFLHVWWARRPLTPSRAAILASLAPANADVEEFIRELGIEKKVVEVGGSDWVLTGKLLERIENDSIGKEVLRVTDPVLRAFENEIERRADNRATIAKLRSEQASLAHHPVLERWERECAPLRLSDLTVGALLPVKFRMADPAHVNERILFASDPAVVETLGSSIRWDPEDLYGYARAYLRHPHPAKSPKVVLDPTSGGGSIPFEAMRLGHQVIANELNPVATVILHATLDYPARFGPGLASDIESWGQRLIEQMQKKMAGLAPFSDLPEEERRQLRSHCAKCPEIIPQFDVPEYDHTGLLYTRTVTCPHCGGHAPLLNTTWLSKEAGDQWGVRVLPQADRSVRFETYRASKGKGPNGEDPEFSTVTRGVGQCIHCKQAIDGDEIKTQARGESPHGKWWDTLYTVAAVRFEPVLDKNGQPVRYATGDRKGEIKTRKVRFFRAPNDRDLDALKRAEVRLQENWAAWDAQGLIPTEKFPEGNDMRPAIFGMPRWCDMFTPRQLLGHVTLIELLNQLKPQILSELGQERGRAVVTYLQFAIDKGIDYNCKQTRWEFTRGIIKGCFGRHDFSLKWSFGEMIFTGPNSGASWGLSQILDSFRGIAELSEPVYDRKLPTPRIINGSATHLSEIEADSVDVVCMDPPYYNNVQYAELSDFFYVWQRRTLRDLYPDAFTRRLTGKSDEAVANPVRDGSAKKAKIEYERLMTDIFSECHRVLRVDGIMTMMFTHKTQDAWETLTRALIESGWNITAAFPVDSESSHSTHQMDMAAAASSIFIACRKRLADPDRAPATWSGLGGSGVGKQIRESVREGLKDFAALRLNPVDEMVASYGRALRVLSENWPVLDGDAEVTPIRAMNEASRVVAEHQIGRITQGRLTVADLSPEAAMCLTLFGIFGHASFPYDEALNLSKSLNIALTGKAGGYQVDGAFIGIADEVSGRGRGRKSGGEETGYHAPLLRSGSKLRLALPEERQSRRLDHPQTEWDLLHGLIRAYRQGGEVVARAYLDQHANGRDAKLRDLVKVWETEIGDPKLEKEARALSFGLGA
jgi:putative DNA methylase